MDNKGKIIKVAGPVVDVFFEGNLPAINTKLSTSISGKELLWDPPRAWCEDRKLLIAVFQ